MPRFLVMLIIIIIVRLYRKGNQDEGDRSRFRILELWSGVIYAIEVLNARGFVYLERKATQRVPGTWRGDSESEALHMNGMHVCKQQVLREKNLL